MTIIPTLFHFIYLILIKLFSCRNYCGLGSHAYNVKTPPINTNNYYQQSNDFSSIRIYLDTKMMEATNKIMEINNFDIIIQALNYTTNILPNLIKVKPLNYTISIRNEDLNNWKFGEVKDELKEGNGVKADLIIFGKFITGDYEISFEQKYIDIYTKRPIVGIIYFHSDIEFYSVNYLKTMILHQITHILGFYKESFPNFIISNGDISKVITTVSNDIRSNVTRTYINTPKVLEYAKKYYNCGENIIGIDLEDQDNRTNSHWEARVLLGEYMNSEPYFSEQVISEFTLALLEDSGWYEVYYYTGGLMRYGKHKGCEFLKNDCTSPSIFKNEFFNHGEDISIPSCSSGRLSRSYCYWVKGSDSVHYEGYSNYWRYDGRFGVKNADYCLAFNLVKEEGTLLGNEVGNCNYGNNNYGAFISYPDNHTHQNKELPVNLGEKYDNNTFCILSSVSIIGTKDFYKFDNNMIHPLCYPIFCSEQSLTIQIYEQYVVCPRSGGKVKVDGIYEGYLFCPDYNLICTGRTICNEIFNCIETKSEIKNNTYDYDYPILTNQIKSELINEYTVIGHELTDNGKCPKYCEQCKDIKKCFKCKVDYNLIGIFENDNNPIICDNKINVSIGYYQNNITKIYYKCTEFCDTCNKTHCSKCNNIHKLNEDNTTCIDKVKNCDKYNDEFNCVKCKPNYYFIGNNRDECKNIDINKYYSLDDISYFPCNTAIDYCDLCYNDSKKCSQCEKGYYFLEENRTHCRNDKDLSEYFSEDNNISYYPCNKDIENCQKCKSRLLCTKCYNNFYLISRNNIRECSEDVDDTYYTEDEGKTYHPCYEAIENCEKCINKNTCTKCYDEYGLYENYKNICVYIGDNRYYTEDGNTYYLCSKKLPNCETCLNNNYCLSCKQRSYFIEYEKNRCYNDKNLSKYYTNDNGITYFLCENNCDTCYNNTVCKTCIPNYYFIGDDRNKCYKIDIEKYYSINGGISYLLCADKMANCEKCQFPNYCDECKNNYYFVNKTYDKCYNISRKKYFYEEESKSYFPCNLNIDYCDECFNGYSCNKCFSPYILLYESPNLCNDESFYKYDKTYFKLNDSFYEKCSTSMPNCRYCNSINYCEECENNYYFLNKNHSECILESSFVPKDEYFKVDDKNYYSCSFKDEAIDNCKKCTNGSICIKCKDEFAFVSNNLKECISKKDLEKKYYHNEDGTMFYPCLKDCDICVNNITCIECAPNYITIYDETQCEMCEIEIINIENELDGNKEYISSYINSNHNKLSKIVHYANNKYNYTITIFKIWECTEALLEKDYYKFNTKELTSQISKKFNINKSNIIYYFIIKNYNNYLEIYNGENGQKLDLNSNCPECINTGFEITNNFTNEMKNELGIVAFEKVKHFEIDIFNKGDPYIKDICKNFTISKIDLSIRDRRKYFNYYDYANEILCTDKSCEIKSNNILNFTGTCECPIKTDFNYFKDSQINISYSSDDVKSYDTSLTVFKCFKSGFNKTISSNTGFYLFLLFIIFQIVSFLIFIIFETRKIPFSSKKKIVSNPPYKSNKDDSLFIEDFNIIEDEKDVNNFENKEKDIQDKDEGENIEVSSYDYIGVFKDDDSQKTKLEDILEYTSSEGKNKKNNVNLKAQNTNDNLLVNNNEDDDYMSTNQFISKKYKKIILKYNMKPNEYYRNYLLLNKGKKNLNKNKKISESFYLNTEGNQYPKTINYKTNEKMSKLMDERRIKTQNSENNMKGKEQIINLKDNISSIKRSIIGSVYNINFKDAENFSFCAFYWYLLGLKQPILNLSSQIKMFKITESFIPYGIKCIRFIFMIALNFFINSLLLSQKYFSNKFTYFDNKYNFRHIDIGMDIPTNERFSYAFKHTAVNSVICFLICFIIQSILNYLYFNIRNKINEIIINNNNIEEEMKEFLGTVITKYKFIFIIDMVLMIFFSCYIINFSAVYIGGDLDYISASILTFIFLQVFPFFICFILTLIRYIGIKVSSEKLYKTSQILAY